MQKFTLEDFLLESNRIEGIAGVEPDLIRAAEAFLDLGEISIEDLQAFVSVAQPDAVLRDRAGLDVRVGDHVAPFGGPEIPASLNWLLARVDCGQFHPYETHVEYETLHPFTDGNGRSGRILWLWAMGGIDRAPLGFLHHFYYQTLSRSRAAA